jgi:hypothetical protein
MKSVSLRVLALAATLTAGTVAACSETTGPSLAGTGQSVSLSFAGVRPPGLAAAPSRLMSLMSVQNGLADTLVEVVGTDTLKITEASIVLRKISLKRVEASTVNCDTMPESAQRSCEEFTIRAVLVSLPLAAGVQTSLSVPVDSGHYQGVEFKIHKPGNDSIDVAFKAANPGFDSISIRVKGVWKGTPFTFISKLDAEQEFDFSPPLAVDASGSATNLTIRMDLSAWFKNVSSGALIDPNTANPGGANESIVKGNIKNSVKAFEDKNHDGDERNG